MSAFMAHSPHSHPWFANHTKRKRIDYDYDGSTAEGTQYGHINSILSPRALMSTRSVFGRSVDGGIDSGPSQERAIKRIRRGEVESDFAAMSLRDIEMSDSGDSIGFGRTYNPGKEERVAGPSPVGQQLESQSMTGPPEVRMKRRTWFEPEKDRIVVLDLAGSDTESEVGTPKRAGTPPASLNQCTSNLSSSAYSGIQYEVSQSYLSRIPNTLGLDFADNVNLMPSHDPNLGALVLYKSPPQIIPNPELKGDDPEPFASIEEVDEASLELGDMAMEID